MTLFNQNGLDPCDYNVENVTETRIYYTENLNLIQTFFK